ncbi:hypothetical protein LSH36_43g07039 [Paralvinella palmiformis]|uniref:SANTA domain-containing protein n=1 Tax=Paralvinella palmiformis TaxID=53620 RepID=A0AAD9NDA3_9ANNE|nr:hypothetical protein LSH36_43g07039 [Paralvinella palmiformis]
MCQRMENFEEDEEFERIVRSVTTKFNPGRTSCLASPLPPASSCLLSTKAKLLHQLKKCATVPVPTSDNSVLGINTDTESHLSKEIVCTNDSNTSPKWYDDVSDISSVGATDQPSVRDILKKLDTEKQTVNEIVHSWKVVDPSDLSRDYVWPNSSVSSEDKMFSGDSNEENLCPRKNNMRTRAHVMKSQPAANVGLLHDQPSSEWMSVLTVTVKVDDKNGKSSDEQSTINMKNDDAENLVSPSSEVHITEMDNWTVQFCHDGVMIEGHRLVDESDQFWHSSSIVKRLSNRLVQTVGGSLYRLVGKMDKEAMSTDDKSRYLVLAFKNGFPSNWENIIKDSKKRKSNNEKVNKRKVKEKRPKKAMQKPTKLSHINPLLSFSGVSEAGTEEDPLVLEKLPKTRSGRLVIPPLSYWTGQRVRIHPHTQRVDVIPGSQNAIAELSLSFKDNPDLEKKDNQAMERLRRRKLLHNSRRQTSRRHTSSHDLKSVRASWKTLQGDSNKNKSHIHKSKHKPHSVFQEKKNSDKKQVTEANQITGGAGTLKRKRQLRELIENQKKDTIDDIYECQPSTNKKGIKIPNLTRMLKEFRTPTPVAPGNQKSHNIDCIQTPYRRPHLLNPVSQKKTPVARHVSPSSSASYDRKNIDRYIHKMKKNLGGRRWGIIPNRDLSMKEHSPICKNKVNGEQLDPALLKPANDQQTDEEDSDYYFSD